MRRRMSGLFRTYDWLSVSLSKWKPNQMSRYLRAFWNIEWYWAFIVFIFYLSDAILRMSITDFQSIYSEKYIHNQSFTFESYGSWLMYMTENKVRWKGYNLQKHKKTIEIDQKISRNSQFPETKIYKSDHILKLS